MNTSLTNWLPRAAGAALVSSLTLWAGTAPASAQAPQVRPLYVDPWFAPPAAFWLVADEGPQPVEAPAPAWWIGVSLTAVDPAVRAQLELGDRGLVVLSVMPKSPAAKAGLKVGDMLLAAGEQPLAEVSQLIEAVHAAQDQPLTLLVYRDGQQKEVTLTPAPRPADLPVRAPLPDDVLTMAPADIKAWMERLRRHSGHMGPLGLRILGPGLVVSDASEVALPDDAEVTIRKRGSEPTSIEVRRGEQVWKVTEETLDQLPGELRLPVEAMLGGQSIRIRAGRLMLPDAQATGKPPVQVEVPEAEAETPEKVRPRKTAPLPDLDQRFDELHQQMKELREMFRRFEQRMQLEQGGPPPARPAVPPKSI